ncbi:MAG: RES domain-containing protein [Proteobacteria bacterium]|nr:RES domain-containing protein [Pseudomonadota bacterium]
MHNAALDRAPIAEWSGDAYRLIPSRFPPVNVYEGLIANDRLDDVYAAENLTNPRIRSFDRLAATRGGDASSDPSLQNWNLAPFAYGNPDGTLFFDEMRPCLELAGDRQTALAVSVARRERFLENTQEAPIGLDMRLLLHPVSGRFWDLRGIEPLIAAEELKQRREIAAGMPDEAQGILYNPPERPAGTSIAVITGDVLGRSVQTVHFRYVWDGRRIALLYAFDEKGTEIRREDLSRPENISVAA